jgi:hypothetical protein
MLEERHIIYIRKNLKKRGIETLDLLEEMTDHFAEAVEEAMTENPKLGFRDAFNCEVAKFGAFGMMKLQDRFNAKLEKEAYGEMLKELKGLFKLPAIIAPATVAGTLYLTLQAGGNVALSYWSKALFGLSCVMTVCFIVYSIRNRKYRQTALGQKVSMFIIGIMVPIYSNGALVGPKSEFRLYDTAELVGLTAGMLLFYALFTVCSILSIRLYRSMDAKYSLLIR